MNEQKFSGELFGVLREVSEESQAHPQVLDMLANLSRRIVAIEKQITRLEQADNSLHRDVETWAQEVERLKAKSKPNTISVTLTLDKETVIEAIEKAVIDE